MNINGTIWHLRKLNKSEERKAERKRKKTYQRRAIPTLAFERRKSVGAVGGLVCREAVVERGEEDDRAHHVEDALLEAGEPVPSLQEEERETGLGGVQIH